MEEFRGKLVKNGQTIAEGVNGRLTIDYGANRVPMWSGYFTVPAGAPVQLQDHFELVLTDGRSGKIRIERVNTTAQGIFASFAHAE